MNAPHWLGDAERLDTALYAAVARRNLPTLDRAMKRVSEAANYSRLWIATAGLLAIAGGEGPTGRH